MRPGTAACSTYATVGKSAFPLPCHVNGKRFFSPHSIHVEDEKLHRLRKGTRHYGRKGADQRNIDGGDGRRGHERIKDRYLNGSPGMRRLKMFNCGFYFALRTLLHAVNLWRNNSLKTWMYYMTHDEKPPCLTSVMLQFPGVATRRMRLRSLAVFREIWQKWLSINVT